jgi:hypothetical protein
MSGQKGWLDMSDPLAGFQICWLDMSGPLAKFQRGWPDMFDPNPDMSDPKSGFLKELAYRCTD